MRSSYVCTTCRTRLLSCQTAVFGYERRCWISQAVPQSDVERFGMNVNRVATSSTRYSRSSAQTPRQAVLHTGTRDPPQKSRLRPVDILGQLEQSDVSKVSKDFVPEYLISPYRQFWQVCADDDGKTWDILCQLREHAQGVGDLKGIFRHNKHFARAVRDWSARTVQWWLDWLRVDKDTFAQLRQNKRYGDKLRRDFEPLYTVWISPTSPPSPISILSFYNEISTESQSVKQARMLQILASQLLILTADYKQELKSGILQGLRELMSLWNQSMRAHMQHHKQGSRSTDTTMLPTDWTFLPQVEDFKEILRQKGLHSIRAALDLLLSPPSQHRYQEAQHPREQKGDYSSSALATMRLLQSIETENGEIVGNLPEYSPWMSLLEGIFGCASDKRTAADDDLILRNSVSRGLEDTTEVAAAPIQNRFRNEVVRGSRKSDPDQVTAHINDMTEFSEVRMTKFVTDCQRQLGRALESQNIARARAIYDRISQYESRNPGSHIPLALYESLLTTFLSLRSPQVAVTVWKQLLSAGHRPTSKTYTVMMKGAQHVRDVDGMIGFWVRMRDAKLQPDSHAWSVYIFGLLRSGRIEAGLQALQQVANEWIAAVKATGTPASKSKSTTDLIASYKEDISGVVRPNIVIMNSAVSALAASNDSLIPKTLAWGRSFDIEPDLVTYNVLINLAMRHQLPDEAAKLLQRMSDRGILPNSTTWTVLLTALFEGERWKKLTTREQEQQIVEFIYSISPIPEHRPSDQHTPLVIDQKGYALIIDRLLKGYNNTSAAQAVLDHMHRHGIKPNAHIYTILMTAYFQESPPNFEAAEALWNDTQSAEYGWGSALDSVFYDRMIEGYAQHHLTLGTSAPMLHFLRRMDSEGKRASWRAMLSAAQCLAERGEQDNLAKLVDDARIRLQEGVQPVGGLRTETMKTGMLAFWEFVIQTGIFSREGLTTVEQVLGNNGNRMRARGVQDALVPGSM